MISANGGLSAHRYTPQVTQRWPRGSKPASKVLQAVVPRPQSTGPRDTYIVRRVCQGPPFARWRRGVREGGALPPTSDPPAVVVGDEEGNTFMGEWYCPQVKPVRIPVAILASLGVCIYVPASRHWLISYSPMHLA